jgi:hypothetical protein
MTQRTKRKIFLGAWVLALAIAASIPAFALLRGTVWLGPGSYVSKTTLNHPLFSIFGSVTLEHGSHDLVISLFGPVHVNGVAKDDIADLGSAIYLDPGSTVQRDVVAVGNSVYRGPGVRVTGRVGGDMVQWNGRGKPGSPNWFAATWRYSSLSFAAGLALLLICVCVAVGLPWQTVMVSNYLHRELVRSLVAGLMGLFLFALLVIPLGLSLFGLPFALLLAVAAAAAWLLGLTAFAVVIGRELAKFRRHDAGLMWAVVSGMFTLAIAGAVPWIGVMVVGLAGTAGAGSLALTMVARSRPAPAAPFVPVVFADETNDEPPTYLDRRGIVATRTTREA